MKLGEALNKLNEIEKMFSKHDIELRDWLLQNESSLNSNSIFLSTLLNNDPITDHVLKNKNAKIKDVATVIVHELKQYAGHTLSFSKNKPTYPEILTNVHKRLCKDKKIDFIEAMTINQREDEITRIILKISIESLSEDEINEIIIGMGLDYTKEKRQEIIKSAITGSSILVLTQLLGKKMIKEFVLRSLESYLAKKIGKKVLEEVIGKLAKKLPQYFFKSIGNFIGLGFLAYDVYSVGGEATRVTTPMILDIVINKSLNRAELENNKQKAS